MSIKRLCGRIPPTAEIKFPSCARSPDLLIPFGKKKDWLSVGRVLHIELELKIRVYVLCWLAVVSDCIGTLVKNDTRPARHKQYTHGHRICLPHRTTLLWLHGLCMPCRARCEKQQKITWLLGLKYAKFSLHEKWNNCQHPYRTVIA